MTTQAIFHLTGDHRITSLFVDDVSNCILIGLSDGRIIKADKSIGNAYLTGRRTISAIVEDGYGFLSDEAAVTALYLSKDAVLQASSNEELINSWATVQPYSASRTKEVTGVFTGPPLWAGEDFIFWREISWDCFIPGDSSIAVQVRAADTQEHLLEKAWTTYNATGNQAKSLDYMSKDGAWIQFRAILSSSEITDMPRISNLSVSYRTRFSVYFFTTKFTMSRGTNLNSGLIIANMSVPRNTEVKIGLSDQNTSDWNQYQLVDTEKAFSINKTGTERIKVGFKMISHSDDVFASVNEFALMLGGEKAETIRTS
jgi:hypothetical protein